MKTLYLSDLDGTLLRSDATLSTYSATTINALVERGLLFSYATARSQLTAGRITGALRTPLPRIVYNGAFLLEPATGKPLLSASFGADAAPVLDDLLRHDVYPIVYSLCDGADRFSYLPHACTPDMQAFLRSRAGDPRAHPVTDARALLEGDVFYFTCIDAPEKLLPLYHRYRAQHHCVYQREVYTGAQWLELMPHSASKSHAAQRLKSYLGCDRLVVFGDGENDLDLFKAADESYAVRNAADALRQIATGVIGSNDEDAVARWLAANVPDRKSLY